MRVDVPSAAPHDIGSPVRRIAEEDDVITRWTEREHVGAPERPAATVVDLRTAPRPHR